MPDILIEQATFVQADDDPPKLLGKSPGVQDTWLPEIESTLDDFGTPPYGIRCPEAMFALPLGKRHVMVVRVRDDVDESNGRSRPLHFQVLILTKKVYAYGLPDPFYILDKFPPDWKSNQLPTLEWTFGPLPRRMIPEVQAILKRLKSNALVEDKLGEEQVDDPDREYTDEEIANAWGPTFLGGVQILVDGGRLVFQRSAPDPELVRAFWTLLPNSSRYHIWPATYAFGHVLPFDLVVVPVYNAQDFQGYLTEDQAGEYPEGRYEMALQQAAQAGDQEELDILFHRRGSRETLKLAIVLVIVMTVLVLANNFFGRPIVPPVEKKAKSSVTKTTKKAESSPTKSKEKADQNELEK